MNRQIRVSVNGSFQFVITVNQDEFADDVAARCATTMKLHNMRAVCTPGQINFIPR